MKKILYFTLATVLSLTVFACLSNETNSYEQTKMAEPKIQDDDLVPDKETAIKIAEAIWLPIYGEKVLKEKPYVAELKDGKVWYVNGTLKEEKGGVAYIEINKKDCRIINVYHTK